MKSYIKGFLFLNILFILQLLVNLIPRGSIEPNLVKTAEQFSGKANRYNVVENLSQSNHDLVTDCLVFDIIANINSNNVLVSTLNSEYKFSGTSYSEALENSIKDNLGDSTSYSRYWHGYTIVYRFLLLFMTANSMKVFMIIAYIILFFVLVYFSVKNKLFKLPLFIIISFAICLLPFSFNTLGHLAPLFLATIGCILILSNRFNNNLLFLLLGVSVAFFDFLSIETLTLTLPLICLVAKYREDNRLLLKKDFIMLNVNWLLGYTFTFIYKWILNVFVLGFDSLSLAISNGLEEVDASEGLLSGLSWNISMIFTSTGSVRKEMLVYILGLITILGVLYLFHKKGCNKYHTISYLVLIFLIPYVRFVVLSNHSLYHFFFTYRAQISSIVCLLYIIYYTIDFKFILDIIIPRVRR